jgi:hypothetical protein
MVRYQLLSFGLGVRMIMLARSSRLERRAAVVIVP